jgi:hypothetical protein
VDDIFVHFCFRLSLQDATIRQQSRVDGKW